MTSKAGSGKHPGPARGPRIDPWQLQIAVLVMALLSVVVVVALTFGEHRSPKPAPFTPATAGTPTIYEEHTDG